MWRSLPLKAATERVGWRYLMALIFELKGEGKNPNGHQSAPTLDYGRRYHCPVQHGLRADKPLTPTLGIGQKL